MVTTTIPLLSGWKHDRRRLMQIILSPSTMTFSDMLFQAWLKNEKVRVIVSRMANTNLSLKKRNTIITVMGEVIIGPINSFREKIQRTFWKYDHVPQAKHDEELLLKFGQCHKSKEKMDNSTALMTTKEKFLFTASFIWFLHWGTCLASTILDTVILRNSVRMLPLGF